MDYIKKYEEKYKDVNLKEAAKYYYGGSADARDDAMGRVLGEMQNAIDQALVEYNKIKPDDVDTAHVDIYIDQDALKMTFSLSDYDEGEEDYVNAKEFFAYDVGEPMAEALVLMDMMDRSNYSTGIRQAVNNWIEDLDFDGFGEFSGDYDISDSYDMIEY